LGNEGKGSSIYCPTADIGKSSSPGGQCNTEQVTQRGCRAVILGSLNTGARQSHSWPSLILAITSLQQAEGQTGRPPEFSANKIPDIVFIGHKRTCNYTALKQQGK